MKGLNYYMITKEEIYLLGGICLIVLMLLIIIGTYLSNPFQYPHIIVDFDISGKRQPVYEDYVDEWINNLTNHRQSIKDAFDEVLNSWDSKCKYYLDHCLIWKSHRTDLYEAMRNIVIQNSYEMFEFIFSRNQTRYRQQDYQRYAYTVQNTDNILTFTLTDMLNICDELEEINYETTRTKYYAKNQRKLMTKELKEKIKERDNYTCQICGKYMPDEVGLHIDHKIPIAKGGKSVESNLWVLCDKCNLSKGKKII